MGKRTSLKDLENEIWPFDPESCDSESQLAECFQALGWSSRRAKHSASEVTEILKVHGDFFKSRVRAREDKKDVCFTCTSYYPAVLTFLLSTRPRLVELDRKIRTKQNVAILKGRSDGRSELLFALIHMNREGVLTNAPQVSQYAAYATLQALCEEFKIDCAHERAALAAYRDFRRSVRLSNGTLIRFYDRDWERHLKTFRPSLG